MDTRPGLAIFGPLHRYFEDSTMSSAHTAELPKGGRPTFTSSTAVQVAVATLLLVSATLKAHQFLLESAPGRATFSNGLTTLTIAGELILSIWLISGRLPRMAWGFSTVAFTCFALYSATALLRGRQSCDCFGAMRVNPGVSLFVDLVTIGMLAAFWPPRQMPLTPPSAIIWTLIPKVLFRLPLVVHGTLGILAAFTIILVTSQQLTPRGGGERIERTSGATQAGISKAKPSIQRLFHDAGRVPPHGIVRHQFLITNTSDLPLNIVDVQKSCGCTSVTLSRTSIQPSETIKCGMEVRVGDETGVTSQTAVLIADSPSIGKYSLELSYRLASAPWIMTPKEIRFGQTIAGEPASQTVHLDMGNKGRIREVRSLDEWFITASTTDSATTPGLIQVEVSPDAPVGALSGRVEVDTTSDDTPQVFIPVSAIVQPTAYADPDSVLLWVTRTEPVERTINVYQRGRGNTSLQGIETESSSALQVAHIYDERDLRASTGYLGSVRVQLDMDKARIGAVRREILTICTTDERTPKIEIPVSYYISVN
jgi:hypothetical protein